MHLREKCKYVHGKTPVVPLMAIADVPLTLPPTSKTGPKSKAPAPRSKYISEAHRIKLGTMTGKVAEANPLGILHNQEVILKYLQRHNDDWDMRGGRDSNGDEYSLNMVKLCDADGSPDEPPTPEPIPESTINEDAVLEFEAKHRYNDDDNDDRPYDESEHRFDSSYPYFQHLKFQPMTPPLPQSAPYVKPEYHSAGSKGFTYNFLEADYPLPERPSGPSRAPTVHDVDPIVDNTPLKKPSVPTKLRMTDDRKDFIINTIIRYHHCLPDNSVIPASLRGYIRDIYDERSTIANANEKNDVKMSFNIFGWTPINLLQFTEVDSLYIYLGRLLLERNLNVYSRTECVTV